MQGSRVWSRVTRPRRMCCPRTAVRAAVERGADDETRTRDIDLGKALDPQALPYVAVRCSVAAWSVGVAGEGPFDGCGGSRGARDQGRATDPITGPVARRCPGARVAGGHRVATRSALAAGLRRANPRRSGRRLEGEWGAAAGCRAARSAHPGRPLGPVSDRGLLGVRARGEGHVEDVRSAGAGLVSFRACQLLPVGDRVVLEDVAPAAEPPSVLGVACGHRSRMARVRNCVCAPPHGSGCVGHRGVGAGVSSSAGRRARRAGLRSDVVARGRPALHCTVEFSRVC